MNTHTHTHIYPSPIVKKGRGWFTRLHLSSGVSRNFINFDLTSKLNSSPLASSRGPNTDPMILVLPIST